MYQLEVKRWLIAYRFPPSNGWTVQVDIDAMERAKGGMHKPDKAERAQVAESALIAMGVKIGAHSHYGRADIVAVHPALGTYIVEVEGNSSRQKEQALYSALGQLVLQMHGDNERYVLAVPDESSWEMQLNKIPAHARQILRLTCALVSEAAVRDA
jgi:hypothetical protein